MIPLLLLGRLLLSQKKEEIERFKAQGVELEEQRQSILKGLEEKQAAASKMADEFKEKYRGIMKITDQLRAGKQSHPVLCK